MIKSYTLLGFVVVMIAGCAGMKVVKPGDQNKDAGTKMVDWSGGRPKIVGTYSCKMDYNGKKLSAVGKTEEDARQEVLARCHDQSVVTFCKSDKVTCVQN